MATAASKLALGTVQFGLDYGISNNRGQVPASQVAPILARCRELGIDTLDTAAAYGASETILGQAIQEHADFFRVISKTQPNSDAAAVPGHFQQSLHKLGLNRLQGYLIHDFPAFEQDPGIYQALIRLREAGLVEKTGFSLYYPAQLERILDSGLPFQLLQIPFNVFDQRFASLLPALAALGVEVHVRSVFLQGLFFRQPATLPPFFDPLKANLKALHQLREQVQVPLASLLLGFAHLQPGIDRLVVGITSEAELNQNSGYLGHLNQVKPFLETLKNLAVGQEPLLLPFNWNKP
jgi:aryl-alcohol dehydrogenase-like predicted oxidoreductase